MKKMDNVRPSSEEEQGQNGNKRAAWLLVILIAVLMITGILFSVFLSEEEEYASITEGAPKEKDAEGFWVVDMPTPNVSEGVNKVEGIILHHTATENGEEALKLLTTPGSNVSCHVMIDTDGTRYVLADPTAITWHAGRSRLNGREGCNDFTVGIEFQGNTVESPLTDAQIESALDYVVPLIHEYNIPLQNIVTHEEIRNEYMEAHPKSKVKPKVDVTASEHERFMTALRHKMRAELFPSLRENQDS